MMQKSTTFTKIFRVKKKVNFTTILRVKKSYFHYDVQKIHTYIHVQSDQQETKSRVLPHLLFYRNVFLSWISRFYLLAVDTRFVGCLPLKNYH
jgi:hypothetical protein